MTGLVFADSLQLTPLQWGALASHAAGCLWWFSCDEEQGDVESFRRFLFSTGLLFCGLWYAFWNTPDSIDSWLLFRQAERMATFDWPDSLQRLVLHPYVKYQTPFLSFWFSRMPAMWVHQVIWFPFALLCTGLMRALYGGRAALLLATPVFALMMHQPCHDTLLFGTLLIVLRQQKRHVPVNVSNSPIVPLTKISEPLFLSLACYCSSQPFTSLRAKELS